jgi:hypothetical protein
MLYAWGSWEMRTRFWWKTALRRLWRRWEDSTKMDLMNIGWEGVDWIDLGNNRNRRRALVNMVINVAFHKRREIDYLSYCRLLKVDSVLWSKLKGQLAVCFPTDSFVSPQETSRPIEEIDSSLQIGDPGRNKNGAELCGRHITWSAISLEIMRAKGAYETLFLKL